MMTTRRDNINHAATGVPSQCRPHPCDGSYAHDFSREPGAPQPDAFVETDRSADDRRDLYEFDGFESGVTKAQRILGLLALIAIGAWALHGISGFLGAVLP